MEFLKISISTLVTFATAAVTACGTEDNKLTDKRDSKIKDYLEKVDKSAKPDVKDELKRLCANPM